jgi:hypothetical protein
MWGGNAPDPTTDGSCADLGATRSRQQQVHVPNSCHRYPPARPGRSRHPAAPARRPRATGRGATRSVRGTPSAVRPRPVRLAPGSRQVGVPDAAASCAVTVDRCSQGPHDRVPIAITRPPARRASVTARASTPARRTAPVRRSCASGERPRVQQDRGHQQARGGQAVTIRSVNGRPALGISALPGRGRRPSVTPRGARPAARTVPDRRAVPVQVLQPVQPPVSTVATQSRTPHRGRRQAAALAEYGSSRRSDRRRAARNGAGAPLDRTAGCPCPGRSPRRSSTSQRPSGGGLRRPSAPLGAEVDGQVRCAGPAPPPAGWPRC